MIIYCEREKNLHDQHLIYTLISRLKAHVPISDINAPTLYEKEKLLKL